MNENEINGICSTHGVEKKRIKIFVAQAPKYLRIF